MFKYIVDTNDYKFYLGFRLDFTVDNTYICTYADADLTKLKCRAKLLKELIFLESFNNTAEYFEINDIKGIKELTREHLKSNRQLLQLAKKDLIEARKSQRFIFEPSNILYGIENKLNKIKNNLTNLYKINRILNNKLCQNLQT